MATMRTRVLVVAILASFVAFLDGSVVNVALPAITREFGGGLALQQWVVDAYLVTLGALMLLAGSLADTFGRPLVMRIGVIAFGVASVLCAVAPSGGILVAMRAAQGLAGALLVPTSLALIVSTFTGEAQGKAIGRWTAWTSLAMIAGPLLGGLFVDALSWRLVFAINVLPIAAVLWLLAGVSEPIRTQRAARIDFLGGALAALALGGIVFALIEQGRLGWAHAGVWLPATLGVACLAGFLWREARARTPMLPLALFGARNFWAGNLATAFVYGALGLGPLILVLFLQEVAGFPATLAGAALIPSTLVLLAASSTFGRLAGRLGTRLFMALGPLVAAGGFIILLLGLHERVDYLTDVLPGIVVFGLGLSITVAPLTAAILGAVEESRSGIASAVNNTVARVAGLVTVACAGLIVGGALDLDGTRRAFIVVAVLLVAGGAVSAAAIRNPPPSRPEPGH